MRTATTLLATLLLLPGCGIVYTHVITPFDTNLQGEQFGTNDGWKTGERSTKHITLNSLSVEWGDRGVGEIARLYGLEQIHYADFEVLSVLGIWTRRWIHLYGR